MPKEAVRALAAKHLPTLAVMASLAQLQTPQCNGSAVKRTGFRPFVPAAAVTHRTATATGRVLQQQPAGVSRRHAGSSRRQQQQQQQQQLACRASAEQVTAAACLPAAAAAALAAACSSHIRMHPIHFG